MLRLWDKAYLFRRNISLSGVAAICNNLGGARFFASAAMLFSCAGGMSLFVPAAGAPGSVVGSDMVTVSVGPRSARRIGRSGETERKDKCREMLRE